MLLPVRLCDEHRLEVASLALPKLVADALRDARSVNSRTLPPKSAHMVASAQAAPMPSTDPHSALVYFMANGGRVKIGYTKSLYSRVQALSLREDAVLLLLYGGTDLERALHAKFGAHRVGDSEWFELAPDIVHFIAGKGARHRGNTSPRPARKNVTPKRGRRPAKKARRSMDAWVELAEPIFHDEFRRLRRKPTANEFATAIKKAGIGDPSESTAKNIRAEILDRTPLPSLDSEA
ncbi:MAG: GIY-YIG nuclease family protein [Streptomyces sp.]|jgi:hypothetical protein|nr:GIY-YIG nuclease family protein [Streptomyces sp.]